MTTRRHISLKTKLAAVLCQMLRVGEDGKLVPSIPHDEAKTLTEDQVLARYQFDHWPLRHADGGPDAHWNLRAMPISEHRAKTSGTKATSAGSDIHEMAHSKRLVRDRERHQIAMLAKTGQSEAPPEPKRSRWASRPFPKQTRGFGR